MLHAVMDDALARPPRLCVLASGSSGNCSVVHWPCAAGLDHLWLIDMGLSPRRTRALLEDRGLSIEMLEGVVLSHLDGDHWQRSWAGRWKSLVPGGTRVLMHEAHRAERAVLGAASPASECIRAGTELGGGVTLDPTLTPHDATGSLALRLTFPGGRSLGYATDLGHVERKLVRHFAGVDVLAIESNYCPRLQASSGRPAFLIERITGGRGHLSNEQAREAVRRISPREHVVLLHLSRRCNRPELAGRLYSDAPLACTIASQSEPTRWIPVGSDRREGSRPASAPLAEAPGESRVRAPAPAAGVGMRRGVFDG